MSYLGTQAQSGFGMTFWVYTGSGAPSLTTAPGGTGWTNVAEITGLKQSGTTNETDDATNCNSTAKEFIPTILSPGEYQFDVNRVVSDSGQQQVLTNFQAKTLNYYGYVLPKSATQTTTGDAFIFRALVKQYPKTVEPTKIIRYSASLMLSGAETFIAGS